MLHAHERTLVIYREGKVRATQKYNNIEKGEGKLKHKVFISHV